MPNEKWNYAVTLPTKELMDLLKSRLQIAYRSLAKAQGEEIYKLQGRAELLEELMNLPEVMADLYNEEEEES